MQTNATMPKGALDLQVKHGQRASTRYVVALLLLTGGCSTHGLTVDAIDLGSDHAFGDGFVPEPCGPATPIAAGTLCGAGSPCVAGHDELVPGTFSTTLGDSPAIAIDAAGQPTIMVPTGTAPVAAAIVWRDSSGTWTRVPLPSGPETASLVPYADALYAVSGDYQGATDWAAWKSGAWQSTETLWTHGTPYNHGMAVDDSGCFFVAVVDINTNLALGRRNGGAWTMGVALPNEVLQPRLALSPGGRLHIVVNLGYPNKVTGPYWVAPPLPPEPLPSTVDINALRGQRLLVGVTDDGALGRAHILFSSDSMLRYATRPAAGGWTDVLIATEQLQSCPKPTVGATCTRDDIHFIPVAVLTSGVGDVRLLYLREEVVTQSTVQCTSATTCTWVDGSSSENAKLMLALPSNGIVTSTLLASLPGGYLADAALDATGTMHVTVIDRPGNLRYLSFGQ